MPGLGDFIPPLIPPFLDPSVDTATDVADKVDLDVWGIWFRGLKSYLSKNMIAKPTKYYVIWLRDGSNYLYDQLTTYGVTEFRLPISNFDVLGFLRDCLGSSKKHFRLPYAWKIFGIFEIDLSQMFPVRSEYGKEGDPDDPVIYISALILDIALFVIIFFVIYKLLVMLGISNASSLAGTATSIYMNLGTRRFRNYVNDKLETFDTLLHEIKQNVETITNRAGDITLIRDEKSDVSHDVLHMKNVLMYLMSVKYPEVDYTQIRTIVSSMISKVDLSTVTDRLDSITSNQGSVNDWIMNQLILIWNRLHIL